MTLNEFFEILGYLASPSRNTKLDVETHPRSQQPFESKYSNLAKINPIPDHHNYYVWDHNTNKWGSEMRIYFNGNRGNIPQELFNISVSPRPGFCYDFRVNINKFIWKLIEYWFLLGDTQNGARIRQRVLQQYLTDFTRGLAIP